MVGNFIRRVGRIQMDLNIAAVLPQPTCTQKRWMAVSMQQSWNNLVWQRKECYHVMQHFSYSWFFPFVIWSNLVFQMILGSLFLQKKKDLQTCWSTKVEWAVRMGTKLQQQQRSLSSSMESWSMMEFVVVLMVQSFEDGRKEDLATTSKLLWILHWWDLAN